MGARVQHANPLRTGGQSAEEKAMVELTRLQGQKIVVNVDLIEFIEETPDTLVTTTTGKKLMVKERVNEIVEKAVEFKRRCGLTEQPPGR
jgi:flagellar protein FlbD